MALARETRALIGALTRSGPIVGVSFPYAPCP